MEHALKWQPGVRAVIVVSEWEQNLGRVVTLFGVMDRKFWRHDTARSGLPMWIVRDGKPFQGWHVCSDGSTCAEVVEFPQLGIAQWKLRLLRDNEETTIRDDAEYAVEYYPYPVN